MQINIGTGKYDITGPCAGLGFMGMSNLCQTGKGIHTRLFSRAFIIEDMVDKKNIALVCADLGICSMAIKQGVVALLKQGPRDNTGEPIYTEENVMIMATHTHSGPGGYSHYLIYNASILGFNKQNFNCIVKGIYKSILMADAGKKPGKILVSEGDLPDCGKIRSVEAYLQNPEIREEDIPDQKNVEPLYNKITMLKFVQGNGVSGKSIGTINWFALHPTNLGEKNKLISGDNKGYAEQLFEKKNNGVIAAFANSCCGDISPNAGTDKQGKPLGPPDGKHDLKRTEIFGKKQYKKAQDLYKNADEELQENVDYRFIYVDMSDKFIGNSDELKTWPAAMGFGMVNGSQEDSRGMGSKVWGEGTTKTNIKKDPEFLKKIVKFATRIFKVKWLGEDNIEFENGQGEKAIFLPLGFMKYKKAPLAPAVVPLQMFKLGKLLIVAHPGELTTVAGIRMRKELLGLFQENKEINRVVISTYANGFCSYVTTPEEYNVQHYEGASNLFGPYALLAFIQENITIAKALIDQEPLPVGVTPPEISGRNIKYVSRKWIRPDFEEPGLKFRKFDESPKTSYKFGDTVSVLFVAGNPNRNLRIGNSYFYIQKKANDKWEDILTDDDLNTQMHWLMRGRVSLIRIKWKIIKDIDKDIDIGTYRILYKGPVKFKYSKGVKLLVVESPEFMVK